MKKQAISVILLLLLLLSNVALAQNVTIISPQKQQSSRPPKPRLEIQLVAEKSGERIYYTTTQWKQLSNIRKTEVNKIGVLLTQGKEKFLISLNELPNWVDWHTAQIVSANQMPSKTQWQIIKQNKNRINDALTAFGGGNINKRRWWNSGETCSWTVMFYDGTEYDNASPKDNKAGVWLATNDIENGFNEVIVHKADGEEYDFVGYKPSKEGHLQAVRLRGKYGFIDITGKVVIPIKFDNIEGGAPGNGYANVWTEYDLMSVCINNKWGYINQGGKVIIPLIYDKVDPYCSTRPQGYDPVARVWKDGLVGAIDHKGTFILPIQYQEIERLYGKKLFFVKKDNKYGFLNSDYQLTIPFKYDKTSGFGFYNELCAVEINGKCGYIDVSGNEKIPLIYDSAEPFLNDLAIVSKNGKYGYINKTGDEVIPLVYDSAEPFHNGLAAISKEGKFGFIDKSGKIIIPLKYEALDTFTEAFEYSQYIAFVKSTINDKYGIINRKGALIVDYKYDGIREASSEGEFTCAIGSNLVYIDAAGNEYNTEEERREKSDDNMAQQGYVRYIDWELLMNKNYELAHGLLLNAVESRGIDANRAIRIIAEGHEKRGEYQLAYDWYLKAVESGDIESLCDIGDLFFYKKGLEASYSKATEWYFRYLESSDSHNNNSSCFYKLGYMNYYGGYGIQKSYAKALDYFEKSNAYDAKYLLGWMYEHGQGVDKDSIKAIEYYKACKGKRDSEDRIKALENH